MLENRVTMQLSPPRQIECTEVNENNMTDIQFDHTSFGNIQFESSKIQNHDTIATQNYDDENVSFVPNQENSPDPVDCLVCAGSTQHRCRLCGKMVCQLGCSTPDPHANSSMHRIHRKGDKRCLFSDMSRCDLCGKYFSRESDLQDHMNVHQNNDEVSLEELGITSKPIILPRIKQNIGNLSISDTEDNDNDPDYVENLQPNEVDGDVFDSLDRSQAQKNSKKRPLQILPEMDLN